MKQWELAGVTVRRDGLVEEVTEAARGSAGVLVDQVPGIVWTTDTSLRLTSLFGEGLRSLGLEPNHMLGWPLVEAVGSSDGPMLAAHRSALAGSQGGFEFRRGGRMFQARVAALHDAFGKSIGTVCVAIEIERDESPRNDAIPERT